MPYHRLDVYQKAYQLALEVHRISLEFPKLEQYGLAQQVRASSTMVNKWKRFLLVSGF